MRRKLLALLGVTSVALVGAVAFAAGPAQAATPVTRVATTPTQFENCLKPGPQAESVPTIEAPVISTDKFEKTRFFKFPCAQVEFTDNCDGTVTVLVKNVGTENSAVFFKLGNWVKIVNGGESETTTVAADDADDIDVIVGFKWHGDWVKTDVEHSWEWNASCLEITSVSNCDGTFKVSVKNTGVAAGEFAWQLGIETPTGTDIPAGATLSENFNKGDIVNIRWGKDNELVKSLEFVQPKGCVTPSPSVSTSQPEAPPAAAPDLPTTGDSLTTPAVSGGVAIALGGLILFSMWLKRRRTATDAPGTDA